VGFVDVTAEAGVDTKMIGRKLRVGWGTVFLDYDNDGDEDLYVVSGFLKGPPPPANPLDQPNVLLQNNGDGTFTDVSSESGADDPGVGRGGAYLDFDGDGCLDLFVANLGQRAGLFRGGCDSRNGWLSVRTVGTTGNRDGIGARIEVVAGGATMIREITAGSSQMGQNTMAAHFGLEDARTVDRLTIRWPGGRVQTLTDVVAGQRITVTEPQ
jgi:hypothetical protein